MSTACRAHGSFHGDFESETFLVQPAVAFKASHFTRDKDGAPAEVTPPLSADADKGDQDTLVLAPMIFTGDGQVADPISAHEGKTYSHEGDGNFRMHNCVGVPGAFSFDVVQITSKLNRSNVGAHLPASTLAKDSRMHVAYAAESSYRVRRLTTAECEILQGFPRDWTAIKYRGRAALDGPRYRAIGNSMAVPCMNFIAQKISLVDAITVDSVPPN